MAEQIEYCHEDGDGIECNRRVAPEDRVKSDGVTVCAYCGAWVCSNCGRSAIACSGELGLTSTCVELPAGGE